MSWRLLGRPFRTYYYSDRCFAYATNLEGFSSDLDGWSCSSTYFGILHTRHFGVLTHRTKKTLFLRFAALSDIPFKPRVPFLEPPTSPSPLKCPVSQDTSTTSWSIGSKFFQSLRQIFGSQEALGRPGKFQRHSPSKRPARLSSRILILVGMYSPDCRYEPRLGGYVWSLL